MKKIIILGSSGLIGSTLYKYLSSKDKISVYGTYNNNNPLLKIKKNLILIKMIKNF